MTASNSELRDWISVRRLNALGGLDEDGVGVVRVGGGLGLRTESLPEEDKTIPRQATAVLTTPTEPTEREHLV